MFELLTVDEHKIYNDEIVFFIFKDPGRSSWSIVPFITTYFQCGLTCSFAFHFDFPVSTPHFIIDVETGEWEPIQADDEETSCMPAEKTADRR